MKKLKVYLLLVGLIYANVCFAQSGWFCQDSSSELVYRGVDFVNNTTGIIVGDGIILKTTNGGLNWSNKYSWYPIQYLFWGINMYDSTFGLAFTNTIIFRTTNAGENWSKDSIGYSNIFDFSYLSKDTIFAAGSGLGHGKLLKSYNGGSNWIVQQIQGLNLTTAVRSIFFADEYVGYLVTYDVGYTFEDKYARIFKTSNRGNDWIVQHTLVNKELKNIIFFDSQNGIASGLYTSLYTNNGGINWIDNSVNFNFDSNKMIIVNNDYCYSVGTMNLNGVIMVSTNNGFNWGTQFILNSGPVTSSLLMDIDFVNYQTGWAIGIRYDSKAVLYKTTNGGLPLALNSETSTYPKHYLLSQNYPNPFNPQTKIKFDVPKASFTKLVIYDLLGREVATLVNEELRPGTYEADWDASSFSSGVYFYKIIASEFVETKKMVLMK